MECNEIKICLLDGELTSRFDDFLCKAPTTMLYASNDYRLMLKSLLQAEDYYLIAVDAKDDIIGALPSFLSRPGTCGPVLNSLPFYGSNGAVIEHDGNLEVAKRLLSAFEDLAKQKSCVSSTLITSPFETNPDLYDEYAHFDYKESRIGQVTRLPSFCQDLEDELMSMFHYKTRNMIRKAQKSSLTISDDSNDATLRFLVDTHTTNMQEIGGIPKHSSFFELLEKVFEPGKQYKVFTAYKDGVPISALLLFYFNNTVEYFTPVIQKEFRSLQPMSLLVFHAMKEAILKGFKWWNWGGTGLTMSGVYDFKKRWGTQDFSYYYYTKIYNDSITALSKERILEEYPNFFVVPFGALK